MMRLPKSVKKDWKLTLRRNLRNLPLLPSQVSCWMSNLGMMRLTWRNWKRMSAVLRWMDSCGELVSLFNFQKFIKNSHVSALGIIVFILTKIVFNFVLTHFCWSCGLFYDMFLLAYFFMYIKSILVSWSMIYCQNEGLLTIFVVSTQIVSDVYNLVHTMEFILLEHFI